MAVDPDGSMAFGSTTTRAEAGSSGEANVTRNGCNLGVLRLDAEEHATAGLERHKVARLAGGKFGESRHQRRPGGQLVQVCAGNGVLAATPLPDLGFGRRLEPSIIVHHLDAVVIVRDRLFWEWEEWAAGRPRRRRSCAGAVWPRPRAYEPGPVRCAWR